MHVCLIFRGHLNSNNPTHHSWFFFYKSIHEKICTSSMPWEATCLRDLQNKIKIIVVTKKDRIIDWIFFTDKFFRHTKNMHERWVSIRYFIDEWWWCMKCTGIYELIQRYISSYFYSYLSLVNIVLWFILQFIQVM